MPVTASQIARELGVSRQSVSKVLVGGKTNIRVSPDLANRIRRVADEMGYRPVTAARTISTGRTNSIDMLMSTGSGASRLPTPLIEGIHDELIARDMQLTVSRLPDHKLSDADYVPKILREHSADGILVNYTHLFPEELPKLIERHELPAIWMNTKWTRDCIYPDETAGFRKATEHLLELGHTRISFNVLHTSGHFSETDRRAGYEQAMIDAGLTPQVFHAGADWAHRYTDPEFDLEDDRLKRLQQWLSGPDRPTAVLAYAQRESDFIAYAAATLGLKLGRDLSLIGVSDFEGNRLGLPLTELVLPYPELGRRAVEMLMVKIDQPSEEFPAETVDMRLALGASTGPPIHQ
ncbi:MAG: LacI family DNA-binding transcriptional regulator [Planctomycetota bacterium]